MDNKQVIKFEELLPVYQIIEHLENKDAIYAVVYDGKLHDLNWIPKCKGELLLIDENSEIGKQIYARSLTFLFIAATKRLFKDAKIKIEHGLSEGIYCHILNDEHKFDEYDVEEIYKMMQEMVKEQLPIKREVVSTLEAVTFFNQKGDYEKANLLKCRHSKSSSIYHLDGNDDYFYGIMLPNTSFLKHFYLRYYNGGVWLSPYDNFVDQNQMYEVFQEFEKWGQLIGVSNIAELNEKIISGKMNELVLMSETKMDKKLGDLADSIFLKKPNTRIIFISGPSSAGKTTFSKRLAIHLNILGKEPIAISMDDFYLNRVDTPLLPDGSYDFESPKALDLDLFNETINKLLNAQPTKMPYYNFKTGKREWREGEFVLAKDQILIIEGIHSLNPDINKGINDDLMFKIYINALTHLNLDNHNRITTSDYRLIRRIVRDYQFRGRMAKDTIHFWKSVKEGEDKYIYPYQERADMIFNSSMVYELSILKNIAIDRLNEINKDEEEYLEANRLKKLLEYFVSGDKEAVPRSSILAEFIGNSIFDVE